MQACWMRACRPNTASNLDAALAFTSRAPAVLANGRHLNEGDGAAIENEARLAIEAAEDSEMLLFDPR